MFWSQFKGWITVWFSKIAKAVHFQLENSTMVLSTGDLRKSIASCRRLKQNLNRNQKLSSYKDLPVTLPTSHACIKLVIVAYQLNPIFRNLSIFQ